MKKALMLALLLAFVTPAQAVEIAGTRVKGQGAQCGEGQGKAVEVNVTTKEETSYCFEIQKPTPPTVEQVETKAKTDIATTITKNNNENPTKVVAVETVTVEPKPITETLIEVDYNATTKVTTVKEIDNTQKEQISKQRAVDEARRAAQVKANDLAKQNQGTEQCVNWSAQAESGIECALDPIPATEKEITDFWNIFTKTFSNWFAMLTLDWRW